MTFKKTFCEYDVDTAHAYYIPREKSLHVLNALAVEESAVGGVEVGNIIVGVYVLDFEVLAGYLGKTVAEVTLITAAEYPFGLSVLIGAVDCLVNGCFVGILEYFKPISEFFSCHNLTVLVIIIIVLIISRKYAVFKRIA